MCLIEKVVDVSDRPLLQSQKTARTRPRSQRGAGKEPNGSQVEPNGSQKEATETKMGAQRGTNGRHGGHRSPKGPRKRSIEKVTNTKSQKVEMLRNHEK